MSNDRSVTAGQRTGGASLTFEGSVAMIRFDRQAARNAMLFDTWRTLGELIAIAGADSRTRAIVLRGTGGHFGAGNDIAEFGQLRADAKGARNFGWAMAEAMMAVEAAPVPVIAAIEGFCYGASVALALSADIRIAAGNASFAITPAKLGALYLRSDHHRLVAAVGPGHARQMIFTAFPVDAAKAEAIGLVDRLVPLQDFEAALNNLLDAIVSGSAYTLHHSKRMLRSAGTGETPPETDESIGWFVDAVRGRDFAEGIDAFRSKRVPDFTNAARHN